MRGRSRFWTAPEQIGGGNLKKKWSAGKITAVVLGSLCGGIAILAIFCFDIFRMTRVIFSYDNEYRGPDGYGRSQEEDFDEEDPGSYDNDNGYDDYYDDYGEGYENSEYYEFHDELRDDLLYQVKFEYYDEWFGNDNVLVSMTYPVVYGKTNADLSGVNNVIQREMEEIKRYAASIADEIPEGSYFSFEADSYVTYMDEETLSVIYVEYGYLDDETYESYVVSVNVDMESGLAMTNSQILDIDDEFSIEFRNRSEKQNGEVGGLSMFSDQEITDMLTDDDSLIIFYTPLGMEVGFNYYYGWVTVTYKDFEKYKSRF